ncbi:MAG: rhodanese-like domain-containing protein [Ignavibacteriales bacterium]
MKATSDYITRAGRIIYAGILFLAISLQGCLKNDLVNEPVKGAENTAEMLVYFESQGDYINSLETPWVIGAKEVNDNLKNYLIIDTRPAYQFFSGHVPGALNIQSEDLLNKLKGMNWQEYQKIVLISSSGQAAVYYATLLRLSGYNNVYSLKYGMAAWNRDFSDVWIQAVTNSPLMSTFTNASVHKGEMTQLPVVSFRTTSSNIKDKIEERVSDLLKLGFTDEDKSLNSITIESPSIRTSQVFSDTSSIAGKYYLVCYGNGELYLAMGAFNPYSGLGHPRQAVLYAQSSELRSGRELQTMPTDKAIVIYCYDGLLSAAVTAYLRVLGYDAKSMLFGANALFYSRMLYDPVLKPHSFIASDVNSYAYETGN